MFNLRTHLGALKFLLPFKTKPVARFPLFELIARPFDARPFAEGFVVSPLNTVAKRDSQERRVIVDLSWPCGSSVNDGIHSGSFLRELLELSYPTIDAIVSAILSLGRGCML